ncbi:adenylate kinase [Perkinsus olseni]|uniref:Adenylate kinase n=1 Tax=Perkinsus olseni TaxID=32597 RepID=A0A7J6P903_PEROL|nr:adenylate kinase [Perkinsus olseni]
MPTEVTSADHPVPAVFEADAEEYLNRNQVYETARQLLQDLLLKRPENPLQFMADWLNHGGSKGRFIILGPPGIDLSGLCDSLIAMKKAAGDGHEVVHIKSDEVCGGIADPSSPETDRKMSEAMAAAVEAQEGNHSAWVISGYPRTRAQARLMLTKWSVVPDRALILTMPEGSQELESSADEDCERLYEERIPAVKELLKYIATEVEIYPGDKDSSSQRMYSLLFRQART